MFYYRKKGVEILLFANNDFTANSHSMFLFIKKVIKPNKLKTITFILAARIIKVEGVLLKVYF